MKIIAAVVVGCLLTAHAFAADAPSPARVKAAAQLMQVLHVEKASMLDRRIMINAMIESNPMMAPYRDVIMKWADEYLSWRQVGPKVTRLYASTFSEAQLRQLIRFYETPTGQKVVRELPKLTNQTALVGEQVARRHVGELSRMIKRRAAQLKKEKASH